MIILSSNKPVLVVTSDDLSSYQLRANLSRLGYKIKVWNKEDMIFHDKNGKHIIELPLSQEETKMFKSGNMIFEIKWLDSEGYVQFGKQVEVYVNNRYDKEALLNESM